LQIISIDLGSNTLRVLKWDCKSSKKVAEFESIVKTAEDLNTTRKISQKTLNKILEALKKAKEKIDFRDTKIIAVATEALRRASNSKEILDLIYKNSKIKFEIIDGKKEALLTLKAVENRLKSLKIENKNFVLVDIGGGSTEIIFKFNKEVITRSFPIGIVTIAQKYQDIATIQKGLKEEFKEIEEFVKTLKKPNLFIATAGTPTTIAAIKNKMTYQTYNPEKINGTKLNLLDLQKSLDLLLKLNENSRAALVGIGREELILTGILIFEKLFKILNFFEAIVIDDSLREGVAIYACQGLSF
jgi:exopolyphosphatase/guanosine-5'-triphosphate,3'-diphosphate pyrophosphatase